MMMTSYVSRFTGMVGTVITCMASCATITCWDMTATIPTIQMIMGATNIAVTIGKVITGIGIYMSNFTLRDGEFPRYDGYLKSENHIIENIYITKPTRP